MYNPQISLGIEFEGDIADAIQATYNDLKYASQYEDRNNGTDAFLWGVRIDFTYNFYGKNNTEQLSANVELPCGIDVRYGVRTGNEVVSFKEPVLVIGVDCDSHELRYQYDRIVSEIKTRAHEIIETGIDMFWSWIDVHPAYAATM